VTPSASTPIICVLKRPSLHNFEMLSHEIELNSLRAAGRWTLSALIRTDVEFHECVCVSTIGVDDECALDYYWYSICMHQNKQLCVLKQKIKRSEAGVAYIEYSFHSIPAFVFMGAYIYDTLHMHTV